MFNKIAPLLLERKKIISAIGPMIMSDSKDEPLSIKLKILELMDCLEVEDLGMGARLLEKIIK